MNAVIVSFVANYMSENNAKIKGIKNAHFIRSGKKYASVDCVEAEQWNGMRDGRSLPTRCHLFLYISIMKRLRPVYECASVRLIATENKKKTKYPSLNRPMVR